MTTIGHISDPHLLEASWHRRCTSERARLSFLSFGRPLDYEARRQRLADALALAMARRCEHVLLTGDLTEDGMDAQFDVLAEVLEESCIDPDRITLVPGNHDLYHDPTAWDRAMGGVLGRYRRTSTVNRAISLDDVTLLPVSTAVHQSPFRSAGYVANDAFEALLETAERTKDDAAPLLVAMHHPPHRHLPGPMQWIDGLQQPERLSAFLRTHKHVFVAHGHTHRRTDHGLGDSSRARIFSTLAIAERESALRRYQASYRCIVPLDDVGHAAEPKRLPRVRGFVEPVAVSS